MGFMKETYSNNRAGLLVTFGGSEPTPGYTPTDSVTEALEYFDLYVQNGIIYSRTEAEEIYDELGVTNTTEVEELRTSLDTLAAALSDEAAADHPILFKEWRAGVAYAVNDRLRFGQGLFKVLQAHTSQVGWEPTVAHSLYAVILAPDPNVVVDWVQPDSTNGYSIGDRVRHNGIIWTSTADNNVWEPGTTNAPWSDGSEPTPEPTPAIAEWEQRDSTNPYMTGDRVLFEGQVYESTIDNNVWSPSTYPAGWTLIQE